MKVQFHDIPSVVGLTPFMAALKAASIEVSESDLSTLRNARGG